MAKPDSVVKWYRQNRSEYNDIQENLNDVNDKFMSADMSVAADMLHASYFNSVASQQTHVNVHERAFREYVSGEKSAKQALAQTVYGNQKFSWFETTSRQDILEAVKLLQSNELDMAYEKIVSFKGLSHKKANFTLAMLGFTNFMCFDSNVENHIGMKVRGSSKEEYFKMVRQFDGWYSHLDVPTFMKQWIIFDYHRNEIARHKVWFSYISDV